MDKPEADYDAEDILRMSQQMKQRVSFSGIYKLFDYVHNIRADLDQTNPG